MTGCIRLLVAAIALTAGGAWAAESKLLATFDADLVAGIRDGDEIFPVQYIEGRVYLLVRRGAVIELRAWRDECDWTRISVVEAEAEKWIKEGWQPYSAIILVEYSGDPTPIPGQGKVYVFLKKKVCE